MKKMEQRESGVLTLNGCTVLGASGFPYLAGELVIVAFFDDEIVCRSSTHRVSFSFLELAEIGITGPGSVTSGGGFIGGGFGVEEALQGMAFATVLNALTTKTKVHTFVTLVTNFGELHLHHGQMEPGSLRIHLADVFVTLRRLNPRWMKEREALIDHTLQTSAISNEQAVQLRARLVAPPVWASLQNEADAQRTEEKEVFDSGPKGQCPSCDRIIPLASESCRHCGANFGQYASWKVIPI